MICSVGELIVINKTLAGQSLKLKFLLRSCKHTGASESLPLKKMDLLDWGNSWRKKNSTAVENKNLHALGLRQTEAVIFEKRW